MRLNQKKNIFMFLIIINCIDKSKKLFFRYAGGTSSFLLHYFSTCLRHEPFNERYFPLTETLTVFNILNNPINSTF